MPDVLIYAPIIGRGGVHRMVTRLAEAWVNIPGWSFTVLSQTVDEAGTPIHWPVGLTVVSIDGGTPPRHPNLFPWLYQQQQTFYDHWRRMQADIAYLPMPWWTTRLPAFKPPMPTVLTLHDFAWDQLGQRNHEFRAEARTFAQHDLFTCFPSSYQRMWGEQHYGFKRTRTVYHGHFIPATFLATPHEAARVRAHYGLPERYVLAFHVGNSKKDPLTILRGHLKARQQSAHVPALVIAGLDTEWYAPPFVSPGHHAVGWVREVVACIQECGFTYGQDLFVLGNVAEADIGGLYAGATAAVTATHNEGGVSGTMFEAFAAHTPAVYTDLPVFRERLADGEYGFTFPAGDAGALAKALMSACEQGDEAFRRAANAFRFANGRTWDDAAREYIEVFEEVLS